MKILVCISSVPDTTSKINFTADKSAFDKNGIQWVINPLDEFALTKAVKLQETQGATVTLVTVGDAAVEAVMRKALAIGANDAVRINTEPKDSLTVAKEIAKVAQEGGFDLILCGKESLDYNGGAVPAMVAQLLNQPFVNASVGLEINGSEATVVREIEGGKETVSVKLPAVIAESALWLSSVPEEVVYFVLVMLLVSYCQFLSTDIFIINLYRCSFNN